MQIKVDEDLPRLVVMLLREKGYQADSVAEQGMSGWKDVALWQSVQTENRFLINGDKGFADLRLYPPGSYAGIMLLRPDQDGIRPMLELIDQVLQSYELTALAGTVMVVTPRGIRVRRSP